MSATISDDVEMEVEAGPSTISVPSISSPPSPLDFDLCSACLSLCEELGCTSVGGASTLGLPEDVYVTAYQPEGVSSVQRLLEGLSRSIAQPGLAEPIARHFDVILLDILARWLDNTSAISLDVWEARLYAAASLAEMRPDLWG